MAVPNTPGCWREAGLVGTCEVLHCSVVSPGVMQQVGRHGKIKPDPPRVPEMQVLKQLPGSQESLDGHTTC